MLATDLSRAFDRLDDFCAVQRAAGGELTVDAVTLLQQAVGVTDDERVVLRERLAADHPNADAGAVLLGILVGLMAAADTIDR
jgi:hypothetical protein